MSKICNNCGKTVADEVKYCPYCKGTTFRNKNELTTPNNDIVHRIFYWQYPTGYVLSKTKIASISVFLFFLLFWIFVGSHPIAVVIAIFFGLVTFLVGFAIHKFMGEPTAVKILNNDYGLITDFKYLLFYWQDRNGGYIISKTKILSFAVFIFVFVIGLMSLNNSIIFGSIMLGVIFTIPIFALGFIIHKLTFKDSPDQEIPTRKVKPKEVKEVKKVKEVIQKPNVIPEYLDYQIQLDELNSKFHAKEKSTRDLIEKRFEPPQLTYTRFISGVDKSKELFDKHLDSAFTMINLAGEYSPRIAGEIETKIGILKEIIDKLEDLSNELVLNNNLSNQEDVDDLINDMDSLIQSVKDYEN